MEQLYTIEEVVQLTGLDEHHILELVKQGKIPCVKVAGVYLRFRAADIDPILPKLKLLRPEKGDAQAENNFMDKVKDFIYFYDYYIVVFILICILGWLSFK